MILDTSQSLQVTRRRFTADQYQQMGVAGILTEDDRVELLDGEVVEMAPIGPRHSSHVGRLTRLFGVQFSDVAFVWVQNPVRLDPYSEPEPDVALLRLRSDFYAASHPTPADVFVVVEVGDSSAASDRQVKALLYARAGIPELLLFDLGRDTVLVCREPAPEGYGYVRTLRRGDTWRPLAFPDREIAVIDMLGEAQ
ncbi:MAG: Uma2 family endonuclease [Chloroflexi bacterium]|nr:Uma2 family endonuclease [Chloroflexota bacterium]